jgi:hypothetical protein
MSKFPRLFFPTIVGIIVYIIVNKLFPKKVSYINSKKDLRGGDIVIDPLIQKIIKHIIKKIIYDRALKIALLSGFATAGYIHFMQEIEILLTDEIFEEVCVKELDGQLKIVCDIINEHDISFHSKSLKELSVNSYLSNDDKINLLKIKLDFIINGECAGKTRFLLVSILAALMTVCVSGVGGLAIFLQALYRLFQEGKISRALYEQIVKIISKRWWRWNKVPVEHLL